MFLGRSEKLAVGELLAALDESAPAVTTPTPATSAAPAAPRSVRHRAVPDADGLAADRWRRFGQSSDADGMWWRREAAGRQQG